MPRTPGRRARRRDTRRARALTLLLGVVLASGAGGAPVASGAPPRAAGQAVSLGAGPVVQRPASSIEATVSSTAVRPNEVVHFYGTVGVAGGSGARQEVVLLRRGGTTDPWTVAGRTRTTGTGRFVVTDRTPYAATYRLKVSTKHGVAASFTEPVRVTRTKADRTMSAREKSLRSVARLGLRTSKVLRVRGAPAVYRTYERGMLVRVQQASGLRTWLVDGRIWRKYRALGGPSGRLGVPVQDVVCGLPEGGCLQRFRGGSLYHSPSTGYTAAYGKGKYTEALAVGLSQRNYREPSFRASKFNTWAGASTAWCAIFQSWMGWAAGNPDAVPLRSSFADFVPALRAEARRVTKPRPGDLALFAFTGSGEPSHVGMVMKVRKRSLQVLDGNTTSGKGSPTRGVFVRERSKHYVLEYYRIDW